MRTINRRLSVTTLQHYKFCGTVKNPDTVLKEKGKWPECDGLSLMGGGGGVLQAYNNCCHATNHWGDIARNWQTLNKLINK